MLNISALNINKGKIKQFNNKGIYTVEDLINFLPRRYYDFRNETKIKDLKNGSIASIIGVIEEIKHKKNYIRIKIRDSFNWYMYVVWFNQNYILKKLQKGKFYNFCGIVEIDKVYKTRQMLNPMHFSENLNEYKKIMPIYSKIPGMSDEYLFKSIDKALDLVDKTEYLDVEILDKFNLYNRKDTVEAIHQPKNLEDIKMARERILFDDLFYFAMQLMLKSNNIKNKTSIKMKKANTIKSFLESLPFSLTNDQLDTTRMIYKDMRNGKKVNALIQGDVGVGKTIIAFVLMLIAAENNYQSAIMCPTNVLAMQHYEKLKKIANKMGYKTVFLSSNTKTKRKKEILEDLKSGKIDMVVGTHAVISDGVEFDNLGLTIVDEEHKFGVIQRDLINKKTNEKVHNISMSATPIPRSLALTIYGEGIDIYNIKQMPKGRKKIKTKLINNDSVAYEFMKKEIKKGRQCYIVCPLIDKSDSKTMKGVLSVNEVYKQVLNYYRGSNIKVSVISGDMKQADIDKEIELFIKKKTDILISTTIVEVGVDIPNSTVMVVQNAERFGLAQLHQLRGRIGRSIYQSYCILISQKRENEKLKIMTETTDGFKIAEADLKLRGAGDFIGTKQHGENKYVMLMLGNPELFNNIRKEIKDIFKDKERYKYYKKHFSKKQ